MRKKRKLTGGGFVPLSQVSPIFAEHAFWFSTSKAAEDMAVSAAVRAAERKKRERERAERGVLSLLRTLHGYFEASGTFFFFTFSGAVRAYV